MVHKLNKVYILIILLNINCKTSFERLNVRKTFKTFPEIQSYRNRQFVLSEYNLNQIYLNNNENIQDKLLFAVTLRDGGCDIVKIFINSKEIMRDTIAIYKNYCGSSKKMLCCFLSRKDYKKNIRVTITSKTTESYVDIIFPIEQQGCLFYLSHHYEAPIELLIGKTLKYTVPN